ncbi:MAG: biopolymer transporter ExbD [Opitutales bacterium]
MPIKRPKYQEDSAESAINISPLIDVLFILLIFFIVTMVFSNRNALDIDSPKANNASVAKDNSILLSITKEGAYYYNGKQCSLGEFERECLELMSKKDLVLMLEADASASVQSVLSLINMAKGIGLDEVYVISDKK